MNSWTRRKLLRDLGISAAAFPFLASLPSLGFAQTPVGRKQRLVIMFSPNGIVPPQFWPDEEGENFRFKRILAPLEPFKQRTLVLHGISNKVTGAGDGHLRGIGCLLTGTELFPGNIHAADAIAPPSGWASGISIDQELKNFLQSRGETHTRFGSLELDIAVPNRADPWTRMSYAGPNQPVTPLSDPYQVFAKLYGRVRDQENLKSVLDDLREDFGKVGTQLSGEDRQTLEAHLAAVREMERDLQSAQEQKLWHPAPELDAGVVNNNDNIPRLSRMQIELLVSALANDMARVVTLQYSYSVGQARMRWLGIEEGHHALSHDPDENLPSQEKLTKINTWFCQELAHLCRRLAETPELDGQGMLLDNTLVVWTNELGIGNLHSLENIPFVCVGGGLGFKMGRSLKLGDVAHNRFLLTVAHAMGHEIATFGNPAFCTGGPLAL